MLGLFHVKIANICEHRLCAGHCFTLFNSCSLCSDLHMLPPLAAFEVGKLKVNTASKWQEGAPRISSTHTLFAFLSTVLVCV